MFHLLHTIQTKHDFYCHRAAKEQKKSKASKKTTAPPTKAKAAPKAKAAKVSQKSAPRVGGKR